MARDNKQVFRFVSVTQAAATNQMEGKNYGLSTTVPSTGVAFSMPAAGTAGIWYQGFSQTLNRAGFRTANADQSILVSGETSAIANDPALLGNTNGNERYCHVLVTPFGPHAATSQWEVLVQGASDTGLGTAGTDWTAISGAIPITNLQGNKTRTIVVTNGVVNLAAHDLAVGDVLFPRANGTNIVAGQPLFVTSVVNSGQFWLSRTPGSGIADSAISGTSNIYDVGNPRRVLAIPITPNPKPWTRVVVRAIPTGSSTQVVQWTGVFLDQCWLTMGRDSASLF